MLFKRGKKKNVISPNEMQKLGSEMKKIVR